MAISRQNLILGGVIAAAVVVFVALGFIFSNQADKKVTAAETHYTAVADSVNAVADSLWAELDAKLGEIEEIEAERDSYKVWYQEAVDMLQGTQATAPAPAAGTPSTASTAASEDWESLGR